MNIPSPKYKIGQQVVYTWFNFSSYSLGEIQGADYEKCGESSGWVYVVKSGTKYNHVDETLILEVIKN